MKRSLIVLSTSFPRYADDDSSIFVLRLIEALSNLGESGTILVPKDVNQESLNSCGNFKIDRFRYGLFKRGSLAFGAGIVPNIRRSPLLIFQAPLLILAMTAAAWRRIENNSFICAQWIVCGFAAFLISLFKGTPYSITVRGEDMRLLGIPIIGALLRLSLHRARAVITVSNAFAQELMTLTTIDPSKIHLIENGITIPIARGDLEIAPILEERRPFLLFIGTIIPRKRVDVLLKLLAQPPLARYSLVLCGRLIDHEEVQRLSEQSKQLGIAQRVFFEGMIAPDQLGDYLARAAAYVSTSEFEGRPNAALEALSFGSLVVLSDIPAHREIVDDGVNGLLIDVKRIEESALKLFEGLNDRELLDRVSATARERVAHLTWESAAKKYQKLFL